MSSDLKTITILFRAHNALTNLIKEDIAQYGLNTTEFGVLEALYHKGPLAVKDIIDKVLIAASSMSYVIEVLKKKGYIKSIKSETDKRSYVISLTDTGIGFMERIYPEHQAKLSTVLNRLTEAEEANLRLYLKRIGKDL